MASTINEVEVYRMMDEIAGLKAKLAQQERNANDVAKSYDKKLAQAYESIGIKESTQRIIKEWQLFAGEKATENAQIAEQLEFTVRVAQDWQARAEAAEKRVAELSAMVIKVAELEAEANRAYEAARNFENAHNSSCGAALDDLWKAILLEKDPDYGDWEYPAQAYRHLKDEYDDLNKRIAELEAQLAATAWRPVTDKEPESSQLVELLVFAYRDDYGDWVYPDGSNPVKSWREIANSNG